MAKLTWLWLDKKWNVLNVSSHCSVRANQILHKSTDQWFSSNYPETLRKIMNTSWINNS